MTSGMSPPNTASVAPHLEALRARAKLSLGELAKRAGYANASSIQRYVDHRSPPVLKPSTAAKFTKALLGRGDPPIALADCARLIGTSLAGPGAISEMAFRELLGLSASKPPGKLLSDITQKLGVVPVVGRAFASYWMESTPSIDATDDWLSVPFNTDVAPQGRYALEVVGPSLNKIALEGHYAICQEFGAGHQPPPDGKYVHAERERRSTGEIEWTIKKVKWGPDGMILCPDSTDPAHQKPLHLGDPGDHVRIRGVVIGFYKPT